jgi:tyrosyl-tRNA synthetase
MTTQHIPEWKSPLIEELVQRGFMNQCTNLVGLDERLTKGETMVVYAGFDCTAESLHVGNLTTLMMLRIFGKHGHKVIPLIGTATTRIGDPSGKDSARPLLDDETIIRNCRGVTKSVASVLGLHPGAEDDSAWVVYNSDWTLGLNLVNFLRDVGRKIPINTMLALESVKRRQQSEEGISFLEFTYSLFQANDFLQLHKLHGVNIQIGGSDQWGNITMGTELVRKSVPGAEVFGITHPLMTNSKGEKMGKTVNGAVWLNADKLSHFEFWQFWRNVDDLDVFKFLDRFSDIDPVVIDGWRTAFVTGDRSQINDHKVTLANSVTGIVRGDTAAKEAWDAAQAVFANGGMSADMPTVEVSELNPKPSIVDLLVQGKLATSKSDARRQIGQGSVRLNDEVVLIERHLQPADFNEDGEAKLSKGRKNHVRLKQVK